MDFYALFKLLHVLAALVWVGGGLTLLANAIFIQRDKGYLAAIRANGMLLDSLARRWFIPASMLTFVFGAITTTLGGLWGELWIILALAGFAATFLTGMLVFEPKGRAMSKLLEDGRDAEAIELGQMVLRISKFDYVVMLLIVMAMVLKPHWTDFLTLGLMATVLFVGVVLFLLPQTQRAEPRAV